ncbi:hypothetical protein AOL_s00080g6 [Orbilia oligospora ATCC 24927]|uniref:FHA domain-containing protein n=1 Tax=Arthrobotrys oligospora (strain ATCC 24927 / CBS 115.81 / DSM 1491) TaxID=756982 RepID=G1XDX1_ARTOA|nr:hypothetical protein AOL_s00080g6 [Orbilia oligospora ATCC 24927]EGX48377.1 hypothetical protein AOL_s00080g6 [Orbilia oligospora ATCC 24927]
MCAMLPNLARIGLLSISSLLLYGSIFNNHATAFKISVDGREVEGGGYLNNLMLCSEIKPLSPLFPSTIFAVPAPAVKCEQREAQGDWVLEELPAYTSAHSYFALRAYNGDYIVHAALSPESDPSDLHFEMMAGTPGMGKLRVNYVKSEFWLLRDGKLQLISEQNPVRDGDIIVLAGPGPEEANTNFHLMRSPHSRDLPPNDYKYQLYSLFPDDHITVPPLADIIVRAMRIRLTGEFGEIVVGTLPAELMQQVSQQSKQSVEDKLRARLKQVESDILSNPQGSYLGPSFGNDDTGGLFYSEKLEDLVSTPDMLDDPVPAPLGLERLRVQRAPGMRALGRGARPGQDDALAEETARLLGLPVSRSGSNKTPAPLTSEGSEEQFMGEISPNPAPLESIPRLPGRIEPPGSGIGAFNELNLYGIGNRRFYHREPEIGLSGRPEGFSEISIRDIPTHWGLIEPDAYAPEERLFLPEEDDFEDLGPYPGDLGYDGNRVPGIVNYEEEPLSIEEEGDIYKGGQSLPLSAAEIEGEEQQHINPAGSDGYQYYLPEVYIYESEGEVTPEFYNSEEGNVDDFRGPAALDISGSLGGIPTSLFGKSSNSQGRNSPYPFGTNQSPPNGNGDLGQQSVLDAQLSPIAGQWDTPELDLQGVTPDEIIPSRMYNNYNGMPLEKIEEEGSGESSARVDDQRSSRLGMQYEEGESNWPSAYSPDLSWEERFEKVENRISPGRDDFDEEALDGPDAVEQENSGSLQKRMESEDNSSDSPSFQDIGLGEQPQYGNAIPENDSRFIRIPGEVDGNEYDDQEELQAVPYDEIWRLRDELSYDSLLDDWDKKDDFDAVSSSVVGDVVELENFSLAPAFNVGLPQDGVKQLPWWKKAAKKVADTLKPKKKTIRIKEPTGFE